MTDPGAPTSDNGSNESKGITGFVADFKKLFTDSKLVDNLKDALKDKDWAKPLVEFLDRWKGKAQDLTDEAKKHLPDKDAVTGKVDEAKGKAAEAAKNFTEKAKDTLGKDNLTKLFNDSKNNFGNLNAGGKTLTILAEAGVAGLLTVAANNLRKDENGNRHVTRAVFQAVTAVTLGLVIGGALAKDKFPAALQKAETTQSASAGR